jgi:phosphatidylglycerol:prolipoprotein diacylglycerol transferase
MYAGSIVAGWIAGYAAGSGGPSSWGAILGATFALGALLLTPHRRAALPYFDVLALTFPFAFAIARAGCFLAHDHIGAPSAHWLAVRFPGGSRFDLGLLECLAACAVGILAIALSRWRLAPGVPSILLAAICVAAKLCIARLAGAGS